MPPKSTGGKSWSLGKEEEDDDRRTLLVRARKGDSKAQQDLMDQYGMRVYSDTERSKMPTYYDSGRKGSAPSSTFNRTPASIPASSKPSQGKAKTKAEPKQTKTTAKLKGKI